MRVLRKRLPHGMVGASRFLRDERGKQRVGSDSEKLSLLLSLASEKEEIRCAYPN